MFKVVIIILDNLKNFWKKLKKFFYNLGTCLISGVGGGVDWYN